MSLYDERLKRTMDAVQMKPVDKIPMSFNGPAYIARRQGISIAEFLSDYSLAAEKSIEFCLEHPCVDSIHSPIMEVKTLSILWLTKAKVPGRDLPADELWQLDEKENIKFEDYEKMISMGYGKWVNKYLKETIGTTMTSLAPYLMKYPKIKKTVKKKGQLPIMNDASYGTAFEGICGGRQLMNFYMDLFEEGELLKKVLDSAHEYTMKSWRMMISVMKPKFAWVGGWRAAPAMLSHDNWMEFVWPYLKPLILECTDRGITPVLHFDSDWSSELETLKELPPRKCILMLDGSTDMRKAREVLGDRMCLMGDVPATMLAFGSDTEVYNYVTKLIDDVGSKTGLIVSSGCDCPLNAKDENVDAMIQAVADYRI